jgi:hypothetical protein
MRVASALTLHWVTAAFLFIARYTLLFDDWRGDLIAGASLLWRSNVKTRVFGRLRLDIREDRMVLQMTLQGGSL